jgi:putative two-component system response regulator
MTELSSKKILIVEDDPDNAQILYELLSMYQRDIAVSGKIAIEKAKKNQPDLILMDVMMPEMDGFECAKRLKSNPATFKIPIIFVTAKTDVRSFVEGFDVGGDDYIMKPYDPHLVLLAVKNKLAGNEEW